jgi:hypothetical protein
MRSIHWCAVLVSFAAVAPATSGPVKGGRWFKERVEPARAVGAGDVTPGKHVFSEAFRGGQRAAVTAIGDHDPVAPVSIIVYDAKNQVVAQAKGAASTPDIAGVIWYPPRDETYRIEIRNYSTNPPYNAIAIAVK